jgi:hypothetical protein
MVEASSWYVFGIRQISGSTAAFLVAHPFTTDGLLVYEYIRTSIRHCITQVGKIMGKVIE